MDHTLMAAALKQQRRTATQPEVWIASELYYPDQSGTGYVMTRIAEAMARDFSTGVLTTGLPLGDRGHQVGPAVSSGVLVVRCSATRFDKNVLPLRLVNTITGSLRLFAAAIHRLRPGSVVIVVTNPPALPFLVSLAARLMSATLVLLIHHVYPDAIVAAGLLQSTNPMVWLLAHATKRLYRRADRIVVLGRDMQALVASKTPTLAEKIRVIPNWADVDEIIPVPRDNNPLLRELGIADKFVVQHSGNMGRTHAMEDLIGVANRFKADSTLHFLLIGAGSKFQWVARQAQRLGLNNVTMLPPLPRDQLSISLGACDVSIIAFIPGMAGISVPSRMYNVLAAGRPIIGVGDTDSELAQVICEERVGWVVPPNDPDRLAATITQAMSDRATVSLLGRRARDVAASKYSRNAAMDAYRGLVADLLRTREVREA